MPSARAAKTWPPWHAIAAMRRWPGASKPRAARSARATPAAPPSGRSRHPRRCGRRRRREQCAAGSTPIRQLVDRADRKGATPLHRAVLAAAHAMIEPAARSGRRHPCPAWRLAPATRPATRRSTFEPIDLGPVLAATAATSTPRGCCSIAAPSSISRSPPRLGDPARRDWPPSTADPERIREARPWGRRPLSAAVELRPRRHRPPAARARRRPDLAEGDEAPGGVRAARRGAPRQSRHGRAAARPRRRSQRPRRLVGQRDVGGEDPGAARCCCLARRHARLLRPDLAGTRTTRLSAV